MTDEDNTRLLAIAIAGLRDAFPDTTPEQLYLAMVGAEARRAGMDGDSPFERIRVMTRALLGVRPSDPDPWKALNLVLTIVLDAVDLPETVSDILTAVAAVDFESRKSTGNHDRVDHALRALVEWLDLPRIREVFRRSAQRLERKERPS